MRQHRLHGTLLIVLLALLYGSATTATPAGQDAEWVPMFNGRDLTATKLGRWLKDLGYSADARSRHDHRGSLYEAKRIEDLCERYYLEKNSEADLDPSSPSSSPANGDESDGSTAAQDVFSDEDESLGGIY